VTSEKLTDSAEVALPAWTAAATSRGGVVAIPTEPGALRGQGLCGLHCGSALLRHQGPSPKKGVEIAFWLHISIGMKTTDSVAYQENFLLNDSISS
jgi:hypothetical protein